METPPIATVVTTAATASAGRGKHASFWDRVVKENFSGTRLDQGNLHEAVSSMAKELGLPSPPHLYVAEEFPAIFGGKAPNLLGYVPVKREAEGAIVMTKKLLELFHYSPHAEVPKAIRAGIGHELGHFKQGYRYIDGMRRYPLLVGPAAAMAGLYLLDKMNASKEVKKDAFDTALEKVVAEEVKNIRKEQQANGHAMDDGTKAAAESVERTHNSVVQAGRYLLAAAAGGVAGAAVTRNAMIELEYDADRAGAKLVKDPHALIDFLRTFQDYFAKLPRGEHRELAKKINLGDVYRVLVEHAHPGTEDRIARLLEMAKKPLGAAAEVAGKLL